MTETRAVGIFIFDEVEVLDFCGPFEVFSVAARQDADPFRVFTIAERRDPIRTRGGLIVTPHHAFEDAPPIDLLLVPGGMGTRALIDHAPVIDWIRRAAEHAELVLSVCTGALLLAKAGLLTNLSATTHHGSIDRLRELAPDTRVVADERYVDNGRVVTSAGISAGIDMSLHIVARLVGDEAAAATARQMEYRWSP